MRKTDLPSQRMLPVYLDIQVNSFLENTTLYECLALPVYGESNSPFACQLQMLLFLNVFLEFPFGISKMGRAIRLVRVSDNE